MAELHSAILDSASVTGPMSDARHWETLYLDARLRAANHIIEMSWREQKTWWTRHDLVRVLIDVLHELVTTPIDQIPHDEVKEFLRQVYLGAWDVVPAAYRDF